MLEEISPMSETEFADLIQGKKVASRHFGALLNLTDGDLQSLQRRAFGLRAAVTRAMPNVTDSHHRISENYGILIAATEMFLTKTASQEWIPKVETHVLQRVLPDASPYYRFKAQTEVRFQARTSDPGSSECAGLAREFCSAVAVLRKRFPIETASPDMDSVASDEELSVFGIPSVRTRSKTTKDVTGAEAAVAQRGSQSTNALFKKTSKVALLPIQPQLPSASKKTKWECNKCHNVNDDDGNSKTYPCTVCKKRFHISCQAIDTKYWPDRLNAKGRHCKECQLEGKL
ncbi:hypothetical protein BV898_19387 [Hypsibius exemplaris]|uniref:Uncharacterized protein n=1 Tax=Hypsibius exemplaris TaxID=2072580 RepID=A0A9X6NJ00_HYPEX|nr:hypothetical protein BV898_19387 [Hypsibius exemplaris]